MKLFVCSFASEVTKNDTKQKVIADKLFKQLVELIKIHPPIKIHCIHSNCSAQVSSKKRVYINRHTGPMRIGDFTRLSLNKSFVRKNEEDVKLDPLNLEPFLS